MVQHDQHRNMPVGDLAVEVHHPGPGLTLIGTLDSTTVPRFALAVEAAFADGELVELDLADVVEMTRYGVDAIVNARRGERNVVLVGMSRHARTALAHAALLPI